MSHQTTGGIYWVSLCYLDILVSGPAACRFHIIILWLYHGLVPWGRRLFTLGPLDHWLTGGLRAHALADLVFLALADLVYFSHGYYSK